MHVASTALFEGPPPATTSSSTSPPACTSSRAFARSCASCRSARAGPNGSTIRSSTSVPRPPYRPPSPGSEEQLRTLAARMFSQRLDRSKPVWEMWLVDGRGRPLRLRRKTHHALVDGVSGVDITTVLFDPARDPEPCRRPSRGPAARAQRSPAAGRGAAGARDQPRRDRARRARVFRAPRRMARAAVEPPRPPARSPRGLLRPTSLQRRRSGRTGASPPSASDLAELKRVKDVAGGTVNESSSPPSTGALGRYLRARGHTTQRARAAGDGPDQRPRQDEHGALGNRVSS